jgi:hypothetical protein
VVVNFEGVIGEWYRRNITTETTKELYIRPGALEALSKLANQYQLVLITQQTETRLFQLSELFAQNKISLTGHYNLEYMI